MRNYAASYLKDHLINTYGKAVYQFGVYSGNTILQILEAWQVNGLNIPYRIYGFDSFEGLPSSEPPWEKGEFNAIEYFGASSAIEAMHKVYHKINYDNLVLIPGWWSEMLNISIIEERWHEKLLPAIYVDIDCDLYESAYLALDFLFKYNLLAKPCIIGYDDWAAHKEGTAGESKAHFEIWDKYDVKGRELYRIGKEPLIQPLFLVEDYL